MPTDARRVAAGVFAVLLVGIIAVFAIGPGIGDPSVPSGEVAIVEEAPTEGITQEEFDRALEQTSKSQGSAEVPQPGDEGYEELRDAALGDLIGLRWIEAEAAERDLTVSDTEVENTLEQIKRQQFGGEGQFQKFLDSQGYELEDVLYRVELQLLFERMQNDAIPETPEITGDEVQSAYDANIAQFQQPETRDVRLILNRDEAKVNEALAQLQQDDSAATWKKVASKFSTDQATKKSGGLRRNVAEGQSEPALDEKIFTSEVGELVEPFESTAGFYLIQVQKVNAAETTPLSEVEEQLRQQLVSAKQNEAASNFETDLVEKWKSRTFCADGYVIDRCDNFELETAVCDEDTAESQGCPAFVPSTRPVAPGENAVFGGAPAGIPQGPCGFTGGDPDNPDEGAATCLPWLTKSLGEGAPLPIGEPGAPVPVPGG